LRFSPLPDSRAFKANVSQSFQRLKISGPFPLCSAHYPVNAHHALEDTTMKLQDLNRSFAKVLAAVAIAFMISAAPAQAQQAQWGADNCYYAVQGGRWVRQGCVLSSGGSQYYHDDATNVFRDLRTNISYFQGQDGRMLILTSSGWMDAQAYLQMVRANGAKYGTGLTDGTRVAANNWPGSGYAVVGGTSPSVTGNAQVDGAINRMYTHNLHNLTAPNNIIYVPAR
jgi:hypothetical protein